MPRILVVDDEETIRIYLSMLLEDRGYEVVTAEDADAALAALEAESFDLVCLDVMMPRRSGITLYKSIRQNGEWSDIPAVFISGFSQVQDLRDPAAFRKTVRDENIPMPDLGLEKPVEPQVLLDAVERLTNGERGQGGDVAS